jgi:hypothetical protein
LLSCQGSEVHFKLYVPRLSVLILGAIEREIAPALSNQFGMGKCVKAFDFGSTHFVDSALLNFYMRFISNIRVYLNLKYGRERG